VSLPRLLVHAGLAALVFAAANTVSPTENAPGQDSDDAPPAVPVVKKSDEKAIEYLNQAIARQGGAALARVGGLASFRLEFGRVIVQRRKEQEDGTVVYATEEAERLDIDWMHHDESESSLKTQWELNGRVTTRAVFGPRAYYWMHDGETFTAISAQTHEDDVAEIQQHRRLSRALIDVAVLKKLTTDGSVWKLLEDPYYPGIALKRTPPRTATGALTFTLWLDRRTMDPYAIKVEPIERGASILHYRLTYVPGYPKIDGAEIRFPQRVTVLEQRIPAQEPKMAMDLWLRRVAFNGVDRKAFAPPQKTPPR